MPSARQHPVNMLPRVRPGDLVDGRRARGKLANRSSIESHMAMRGVREVPMSFFTNPGESPAKLIDRFFYAKDDKDRVRALAKRIQRNNRISPLIVAIDKEGPYVLEGGHRIAALGQLGAKSFPALVVTETGSAKWGGWSEQPRHPKGSPQGGRWK